MKNVAKYILRKFNLTIHRYSPEPASAPTVITPKGLLSISALKEAALAFMSAAEVRKNEELLGHKLAFSNSIPCLYGTIACVLLKSLLGKPLAQAQEELDLISSAQRPDGLFYDPSMECSQAYTEDWWGWRHLTMHALMAMGLYGQCAKYPTDCLEETSDADKLRNFVDSMDWGPRVAFTSNAVQNYGVMLQYARDFQNSSSAGKRMEAMFDVLTRRIDPLSGMFGSIGLIKPIDLSEAVQAAYHFWLLWAYEGRDIPFMDKAIGHVLRTQNVYGGFGVLWNSSCCEDIDSIDPLSRYLLSHPDRQDVRTALEVALRTSLQSLNIDGGFAFRRNAQLSYGYTPAMYAGFNESTTMFTWFRMLSIAYATEALGHGLVSEEPKPSWNWGKAPGLQFAEGRIKLEAIV